MAPLSLHKIPIVVPRQKKYYEHVNDHQYEFCKVVSERQDNIIVIEDIDDLAYVLNNYNEIIKRKKDNNFRNNDSFSHRLLEEITKLFN